MTMAMRAAEQATALAPKPQKALRDMTPDELTEELKKAAVPALVTGEMERRGMKVPSYGEVQKPKATPKAAEDEGRGTLLRTKVGEVTGTYLPPSTAKKDIMADTGFVAPTAKASVLEKANTGPAATVSVQLKRVIDQTGGDRTRLAESMDRYKRLGMADLANEIDRYLKATK